MSRRCRVLMCSLSLLTCLVYRSDFWNAKPQSKWTREEALKLLGRSPWTATEAVTVSTHSLDVPPLPPEGSGTCASVAGEHWSGGQTDQTIHYLVRFESAAPVRMALGRLMILDGRISEQQLEQFLNQVPSRQKVAVSVFSPSDLGLRTLNDASDVLLKEASALSFGDRGPKLLLDEYLSPARRGGSEALFIFSRENLDTSILGQKIQFVTRLREDVTINVDFTLEKMLYRGKLAL